MSNPTINFRLSPYQIARGLQIIRQLEPNYKFTSTSKLVRALYLDYLAKMSLNKPDSIPQHYLDEVESLLYQPIKPITNLREFTKRMQTVIKEEPSTKSVVENFKPLDEWMGDE